jgi:homoserine kinase
VCSSEQQAQRIARYLDENYIQNEDGFSRVCQIPQAGTVVSPLNENDTAPAL